MNKSGLFSIIVSLIAVISMNGQQKVALQSNGTTTIFGGANPLTDAYNAAINGDTLYLPGGTLPASPTINKSLVIIGAGHYPDSSAATGKTMLSGGVSIAENADNLWLEGIEFLGNLSIVNNNKVDSMTIKRCKFNELNYSGNGVTPCINNRIYECVITSTINFSNAYSSMLSNNIINARIINANNIGISNNILLYNAPNPGGLPTSVTFYNVDNCFITNNIIFRNLSGVFNLSDLNTFSNNIFSVVPTTGTNTFSGNYYSVDLTTLFVNQSGNVFDYKHDYHLVNPSLYVGVDSTEVGIFGGFFPYKNGAVPHNPHIQFKNIAPTTNANGSLQVQIQAQAQDR